MNTFFQLTLRKDIVKRAAKTSLLIGSLLILINQWDVLLSGNITLLVILKMMLTYCVPYGVSTYASVQATLHPM